MRRLVLAALLAAGPVAAEIPWSGQQFDTTTCAEWEELDMAGRVDRLKAVEPFGDDLEPADRGAAEDWANEVAAACAGRPERLLTEAAAAAETPGG